MSLKYPYSDMEDNFANLRNAQLQNVLNEIPAKYRPYGSYVSPIKKSVSTAMYSYFLNEYYITSERRLKGIGFIASKDGFVNIDFFQLNTETQTVNWLNSTGDNKIPCKKGWNYIQESQIKIPIFYGSEVYVAIRSEQGTLFYSETDINFGAFEVYGGDNSYKKVIWSITYFVDTYNYDIQEEIKNKSVIHLPQGNIDIKQPIILQNQVMIGSSGGLGTTQLRAAWITGVSRILVELKDYGELRDVYLDGGHNNDYTKNSNNYCNNLEEIQNLTNWDMTNDSFGLHFFGVGCRAFNVNITGCGIGVQMEAQNTRQVHSYLNNIQVRNCFLGYNFLPASEYECISNISASNNVIGLRAATGNLFFSSCNFNDNRVGLHYYKAGNDAHGSFAACNFNHNLIYSLVLDQISHGETFVGCHVFEGDIYLFKSIGFNFNGGTIDANILVEGGKSQLVQGTSFQNAYWDRTKGISHNYNGETSYLKMINNFFMFETGENDNIINN